MARAVLISKLNHPVVISYDGKGVVIPPYGRIEVENDQKLGSVPRGILMVKRDTQDTKGSSGGRRSKSK